MPKLDVNLDTTQLKNTLFNFIVPIISLGISAALFLLILYPSINNIPSLETEKQSKTKLRNDLNQKLENLNRLVDFKSIVDENSALVDRVLRTEDNVPQLLNQIDEITKNSGLLINKLSYSIGDSSREGTEGGTKAIFVSLGSEGTYGQMVAFLQSTENAARFIQVNKVRYSDATSQDDSGIYNMSFSISSPYLFVTSEAVTDEPVDLDIASQEFVDVINRIKNLKFYDYLENLEIPEIAEETSEEELAEEEEEPGPVEEVELPVDEVVEEVVPTPELPVEPDAEI